MNIRINNFYEVLTINILAITITFFYDIIDEYYYNAGWDYIAEHEIDGISIRDINIIQYNELIVTLLILSIIFAFFKKMQRMSTVSSYANLFAACLILGVDLSWRIGNDDVLSSLIVVFTSGLVISLVSVKGVFRRA